MASRDLHPHEQHKLSWFFLDSKGAFPSSGSTDLTRRNIHEMSGKAADEPPTPIFPLPPRKLPSEIPAPGFLCHPFPPALVTPFLLLSQSLPDNPSKIPGRSLLSMRTEPNCPQAPGNCWDAPASPNERQNPTRLQWKGAGQGMSR